MPPMHHTHAAALPPLENGRRAAFEHTLIVDNERSAFGAICPLSTINCQSIVRSHSPKHSLRRALMRSKDAEGSSV